MKYENTDFVIDWETMGSDPDTIVLSFAISPFIEDQIESYESIVSKSKYWKFDLESQHADGRSVNLDTLEWWETQPKALKDSQFNPTPNDIKLKEFVVELEEYLAASGLSKYSQLYCRGASFDYPILAHIVKTYSNHNHKMWPVAFWNQNCIRSYIRGMFVSRNTSKVPLPKGSIDGFVAHDPLHDCARGVMHIQYARSYAAGLIDIPEGDDIDPNSNT